jgi:hypothetical protein
METNRKELKRALDRLRGIMLVCNLYPDNNGIYTIGVLAGEAIESLEKSKIDEENSFGEYPFSG